MWVQFDHHTKVVKLEFIMKARKRLKIFLLMQEIQSMFFISYYYMGAPHCTMNYTGKKKYSCCYHVSNNKKIIISKLIFNSKKIIIL